MLNSNLATIFTLVILGLVAAFGYYQGVITLVMRRADLSQSRQTIGGRAVLLGLLYLLAAITASAVAVLFYFSL